MIFNTNYGVGSFDMRFCSQVAARSLTRFDGELAFAAHGTKHKVHKVHVGGVLPVFHRQVQRQLHVENH